MEDQQTKVLDLIIKARKNGVSVFLDQGKVKVAVDENVLVEDALIEEIRQYKSEIKHLLDTGATIHHQPDQPIGRRTADYTESGRNIPLSFGQEQLWLIDQLEGTLQYHIPMVVHMKGLLDQDALSSAFRTIIQRHQALRTIILEEDGRAYQETLSEQRWQLGVERGDAKTLDAMVAELVRRPFNLAQDFKLRADIIILGKLEYVLVLVVHHIAADGWSMPIIANELKQLYRALCTGTTDGLPQLPVQYGDYAIWQRDHLQGPALQEQLEFWEGQLSGVEVLRLPTDYTRPVIQTSHGGLTNFTLDSQLTQQLNQLSLDHRATLFITLLTAFKVLMYRYSGQTDICVGSVVANRGQHEIRGLIGYFANPVALRSDLSGDPTFSELLRKVRLTALNAYDHQHMPFEQIVGLIAKDRDTSRNPLFQVMFELQHAGRDESDADVLMGMELSGHESGYITSKFDLTFSLTERIGLLEGRVEYKRDLFEEATVVRMIGHFMQLLHSILADATTSSINQLRMLTGAEQKHLLTVFNNPVKDLVAPKTIIDLFREQVLRSPKANAVICGDKQLSFEMLNKLSDALARYLHTLGVRSGSFVAICVARSVEMVIGILAIQKAGAAYVPIDPDCPEDRVTSIIEDAGAKIIVSNLADGLSLRQKTSCQVIDLHEGWEEMLQDDSDRMLPAVTPDDLAYVIYTSGSTGRPKGVMVAHSSLYHYVTNRDAQYTSRGDRTGAGSYFHLSYTFDASLTSLFQPLIVGRTLVLAASSVTTPAELLDESLLLPGAPYDFIKLTPAHLPMLEVLFADGAMPTNRLVIGGEELLQQQFQYLINARVTMEIINEYGPTEATVGCTTYRLHTDNDGEIEKIRNGRVPIGRPMANTQIFIVDGCMSLQPIGVPGEICIGGPQVARGYLNQKALSEEKFVADPFSGEQGATLYKTGDIGRWLPDGNIEYLGRHDEQVKVNGYRIEPAEIAQVALRSGLVSQLIVVAREDAIGMKHLVGYVVTESPADPSVAPNPFDKDALMRWLESLLPRYMVPQVWIELAQLPLTSSGKVDRGRLPDPDLSRLSKQQFLSPDNSTEEALVVIWQDLLKVGQISTNDNFFELGGNSVLVMRLAAIIRQRFGKKLTMAEIFRNPTIAAVAEILSADTASGHVLPTISALSLRDRSLRTPLSFGQERFWFVDQLEGTVQYHLNWALRISGDLDVSALEKAFMQVLSRHEILRTVIRQDELGLYQQTVDHKGWKLESVALPAQYHLADVIEKFFQRPFDLASDFKMRVGLIKTEAQDFLLLTVVHHIAADAMSVPVIAQELGRLYQFYAEGKAPNFPAHPQQYADYAVWQRNLLQGEVLDKSLEYWRQRLSGVLPIKLPSDYPRPLLQSTRGQSVRIQVDESLLDQLHTICNEQGVTMFMLLLAAYQLLLHKYTGQDNICVGVPVAGRDHPGTEDMVGFFVNTLAFRYDIDEQVPFLDFLRKVKEGAVDAFQHQDIPFEKVVESLNLERDRSRNPIFDVKFSYEKVTGNDALNLGQGLRVATQKFGSDRAQLDLSMDVRESSQGLQIDLTFCVDIFAEDSIDAMGRRYRQLLRVIADHPDHKIMDMDITTADDVALLKSFNNTWFDHPRNKTIVEVFEEQVNKYPENTALIFDQQMMTYSELNQRANQLAGYLRRIGVNRNDLVPICEKKSIGFFIAVLAVMKAGGAYVPLDPDNPVDRIRFVAGDCDSGMILIGSDESLLEKFTGSWCEDIILVSIDSDAWAGEGKENLPHVNTSSDLAYCIYTSGTTGEPKGVLIEHQGLVNVSLHHVKNLQVACTDRVMQFFASAFDASVLDTFTALSAGAALVIPSQEMIQDATRFVEYLDKKRVSIFTLTPSYLSILSGALMPSVRVLITGGEACNIKDALYYSRTKDFYNAYGPSEVTVNATLYKVDPNKAYPKAIPIGKPSDNKYVRIMKGMQNCPVGITGEICIGGIGLSRGYLNNRELTQSKFVADPYLPGQRLYRTGDLGKWLSDGNIEYVGRLDDQVKIRGYRIEPGEIESVMLQSGLVNQVIVLPRGELREDLILVAYLVARDAYDQDAILQYISDRLPHYMIPSILVRMATIPMTPNGKVDKDALPDPGDQLNAKTYSGPVTEMEKILCEIWKDLLGLERVGIDDDFFDIGGHSLLAIKMASALRGKTAIDVSIADIFDLLSIRELAAFLTERPVGTSLPPILKSPRSEQIPLSFAQERLWFIDQLKGSLEYNIPIVLRLSGQLDLQALNHAFSTIVKRHEVLRTVIIQHDDHACQTIMTPGLWEMQRLNVWKKEEDLQSAIEILIKAPFDLSKDHMLKVTIIPVSDEDNILVVVLHHIAVDGWSLVIFEREFFELYNAHLAGREPHLSDLNIQYADYAIWQRKFLTGDVLREKLGYWEEKLKGLSSLDLPTDFDRNISLRNRQGEMQFTVDQDRTAGLRELATGHDATMFMVMLAAFKVVLYRYTGVEDICVGGAIANRAQHEVTDLIGLFINMFAIRDNVQGKMNFLRLLESVKRTTQEAYNHHEAPFEKVAEMLLKERKNDQRNLFRIWFILQTNADESYRSLVRLHGLEMELVRHGQTGAKSDIGVSIVEASDKMTVNIAYDANLYLPDTIEGLARFYDQLLDEIVRNPFSPIGKLMAIVPSADEEESSSEIDRHSSFNFDN